VERERRGGLYASRTGCDAHEQQAGRRLALLTAELSAHRNLPTSQPSWREQPALSRLSVLHAIRSLRKAPAFVSSFQRTFVGGSRAPTFQSRHSPRNCTEPVRRACPKPV